MEIATINCPNCTALLKISGSPRPGKSVRCPQCHFTFRLPHEPAPTSPRATSPAPPEMQAPAESPPEERSYKIGKEVTYKQEEVPRVRPRRFRPERPDRYRMPMPWIPWAVGGLAGLAIVGVMTIVIVAVWRSGAVKKLVAGGSIPAGWKEVVSAEGRFRVLMPGTPTVRDRLYNTPFGPLKEKAYVLNNRDCSFVVSHVDLDSGQFGNVSPVELVDGKRECYLEDFPHAKFLGERPIVLQGYSGKELRFHIPGEVQVTFHVYAVKRRFYTVCLIGDKQDPPADVVNRFLDSFQLTD